MAKKKKYQPPPRLLDVERWVEFLKMLQEETDRGAALVGGAMLDKQLLELIRRDLIDDDDAVDKLLKDKFAPISTFSARIETAY